MTNRPGRDQIFDEATLYIIAHQKLEKCFVLINHHQLSMNLLLLPSIVLSNTPQDKWSEKCTFSLLNLQLTLTGRHNAHLLNSPTTNWKTRLKHQMRSSSTALRLKKGIGIQKKWLCQQRPICVQRKPHKMSQAESPMTFYAPKKWAQGKCKS